MKSDGGGTKKTTRGEINSTREEERKSLEFETTVLSLISRYSMLVCV
jgi:hypothetical protein